MTNRFAAVVGSVALLVAPTLAPAPALAQVDPSDACWSAVVREARGQYAADGVDQLSSNERQGSTAETVVSGTGEANGRRFAWECTFNVRTGQTYGVRLNETGSAGRDNPQPHHSGNSSAGAAAGAVLGAAILGAIVAGASKHHSDRPKDDWFTPSPGVQCSRYQRACYSSGSFDYRWTRRTF